MPKDEGVSRTMSTASAMGPITSALAIEAAAIVLAAALCASKCLFALGTLLGTSDEAPLKKSASDNKAVDIFVMVPSC